ncbi:Crp/Fnr family transcriptional regulator [Rhodanobacter sp. T12-5]|nr:Crp/Fnr family transcriptional regulator [Rhodanobacter sp. T12-5]
MPDAADPSCNALLAALSTVAYARLSPHMEPVRLLRDQRIHDPHVPQRQVYFPIDCIVSLQTVLSDGSSDEIAIVGNEGVVGIAVVMGSDSAPSRALVRRAGHAWRIKAECLRHEFQRIGELQLALLRYSQALLTQIAQTAVCNRHHMLDQQLCRWLLMTLDRLPSNELTVTQEQIANMLGVRREGVTEAAGKLQRAGAIRYSRGRIDVLDRRKLEESACECYRVVSRECSRRLPPPLSIAEPAVERQRQEQVLERPFRLMNA